MGPRLALEAPPQAAAGGLVGVAPVRREDGAGGALLAARPAVPDGERVRENRLRRRPPRRGHRHHFRLRSAEHGLRSRAAVPTGLLQGTGTDHRDHHQGVQRVAAGATHAAACTRPETAEGTGAGVLRQVQEEPELVRRQGGHHLRAAGARAHAQHRGGRRERDGAALLHGAAVVQQL